MYILLDDANTNMSNENESKTQSATRLNKIVGGLQEILNLKHLIKILEDPKYRPKGYWGTAPTGSIHLGYFCPIMKIADLVEADCDVTILLADIHAFMDSNKSSKSKKKASHSKSKEQEEQEEQEREEEQKIQDQDRTIYYQEMITQMLLLLKVDINKVKFVRGSSFQYSSKYIQDTLLIANNVSISDAKNAGTEVVKQSDNPRLTSLIYPIMQALDEKYLNADFELGGIDQRKIFGFAIDHVHKYTKCKIAYLMNPIIPALSLESFEQYKSVVKMSSTVVSGKIDILDKFQIVNNKLKKIYCKPGEIDDNTLLTLCKGIIFPLLERTGKNMLIERSEKFGGNIEFKTYDELEESFATQKIHPSDLKSGVAKTITDTLKPIRDYFEKPELIELLNRAYGE